MLQYSFHANVMRSVWSKFIVNCHFRSNTRKVTWRSLGNTSAKQLSSIRTTWEHCSAITWYIPASYVQYSTCQIYCRHTKQNSRSIARWLIAQFISYFGLRCSLQTILPNRKKVERPTTRKRTLNMHLQHGNRLSLNIRSVLLIVFSVLCVSYVWVSCSFLSLGAVVVVFSWDTDYSCFKHMAAGSEQEGY